MIRAYVLKSVAGCAIKKIPPGAGAGSLKQSGSKLPHSIKPFKEDHKQTA